MVMIIRITCFPFHRFIQSCRGRLFLIFNFTRLKSFVTASTIFSFSFLFAYALSHSQHTSHLSISHQHPAANFTQNSISRLYTTCLTITSETQTPGTFIKTIMSMNPSKQSLLCYHSTTICSVNPTLLSIISTKIANDKKLINSSFS